MVQKVDQTEWENIVVSNCLGQLFHAPFIHAVTLTYKTKPHYYLATNKEKLLLAFVAFEKDHNISVLSNLWYQPLFVADDLSDVQKNELLQDLINQLKTKFNVISLRLSPHFGDIRPFIWNNFSTEVRYTYVKSEPSKSHYSIDKNLKKIDQSQFVFKIESISKESLTLNLNTLKEINISLKNQIIVKDFIENLGKENICKAANLYQNDIMVASCIMMVDDFNKQIFTLFLNSNSKLEKYAHTYLYQTLINYTFNNGYQEIDLCGANMLNIANFKSYFNCSLKAYYLVSYNPSKAIIREFVGLAKKFIRKLKDKFN
jgi:hypothetical protein